MQGLTRQSAGRYHTGFRPSVVVSTSDSRLLGHTCRYINADHVVYKRHMLMHRHVPRPLKIVAQSHFVHGDLQRLEDSHLMVADKISQVETLEEVEITPRSDVHPRSL